MTVTQTSGRPKGGYKLADGTKIPGVTTIIGRFKDSAALMFWAFAQGKAGKEKLYDDAEKAAEIGTYAHDLVRAHIHHEPQPASPLDADGTAKAMTAFGSFQKWAEMTRLNILHTEIPLVCEVNKFGGTIDAIGIVGDELCLLDWKSSNGVYPDYLIQLAAYKHLWTVHHPDKPIQGFHLLRFSKENGDFVHHHWPQLDEAWSLFVLYRHAYELDKQLKKRV